MEQSAQVGHIHAVAASHTWSLRLVSGPLLGVAIAAALIATQTSVTHNASSGAVCEQMSTATHVGTIHDEDDCSVG